MNAVWPRWADSHVPRSVQAVAEIQPLFTGAGLNLGERVLSEVERNSFIALPGKGGHSRLMPFRLCARPGEGNEKCYTVQGAGRDQLVDILLIGWWWGNRESAPSTFWFQPVWGLRACGQHTVNFFHLVGDSVSAKQLKGPGSEYSL